MAELQPIYGFNHPQLNILPVEYRDVPGFPGYIVSSIGTIYTLFKHNSQKPRKIAWPARLIKLHVDKHGYKMCRLSVGGKAKNLFAHSVVLLAFVGEKPDRFQACHNNGIRDDNRVENLRWDSAKNNQADRKKHGTDNYDGSRKHPKAVIKEVAERLRKGVTTREIEILYGISQGYACRIRRRFICDTP